MNTADVKNIKLAKKYSNALLESAIEHNVLDKVYNDIIFVDETIKTNKELKEFLNSPLIKIEDKKDVISRLFSIHVEKITLDFIYLLLDNTRIAVLDEILNQFSSSYNRKNNVVTPNIISAVELDDNQKRKIIKNLENKLLKKIKPQYIINKEIIGGLILEIEDKTIDCSLKTKFENMKKQLTKGSRYGSN